MIAQTLGVTARLYDLCPMRQHSACITIGGSAPEEDEDEESESLPAAGCAMSLGMFFRCSRMLSVNPPSPMEVKKLMLKRMLRGVSCRHLRPIRYLLSYE